MKKVHIFDMDGTLINSMPHIVRSILHVLDEDHIVYGPELIDAVIPLGYPKTAERFQAMGAKGTVDEIVARFMKLLYQAYSNDIPLKPGAAAYLRKLKEQGARLCVLTGSPHLLTDVCLQRNGIFDLFDYVWSVDDFGHCKDEPIIYHQAAAQLGCAADDICFYDDNLIACTTAVEAGWYTCAVNDGQSEETTAALRAVADAYIPTFEAC